MRKILLTTAAAAALVFPASMAGALTFNEDVKPGIIMGTGIANGAFTVAKDKSEVGELALRAKLRFPKEDTFNSNGDGTYSMPGGAADPGFSWDTDHSQTPRWSFEWSINTNVSGTNDNNNLGAYSYELGLDGDPTSGAEYLTFDPIKDFMEFGIGADLGVGGGTHFDHAIGNNDTTAGTNAVGTSVNYSNLISSYDVAQNSWNYSFFLTGALEDFNPNTSGEYTIYLAAFDRNHKQLARTEITVNVSAVPLPASALLLLSAIGGLGGLSFTRRRWARAA